MATKQPFKAESNRKEVLVPHLLRLAQKSARESIELGSDGGLDEVIAVIYLKGAYGHLPVATYDQFAEAFDIYG